MKTTLPLLVIAVVVVLLPVLLIEPLVRDVHAQIATGDQQ